MLPSDLEFYPYISAIYAVSIYAAFFLVSACVLKLDLAKQALPNGNDRYGDIDGLRGLLAVAVMVHHSFAAYGYFTNGQWIYSTSPILNQLGQTSVAMFFMITGYLFTLKSFSENIDWSKFYKTRLARLTPLYVVIVALVFLIVLVVSKGEIREPLWKIGKEAIQWFSFVFFGRPDINEFKKTWVIIAGVNWSLQYEMIFYIFFVPVLHYLSKFLSVQALFINGIILLILIFIFRWITNPEPGNSLWALHFLGGVLTAYAFKIDAVYKIIKTRAFTLLSFLFGISLLMSQNSYGILTVAATIFIFATFARGLSIFGLLKTKPALWIGEISYGIYLIHGMVLWIVLTWLKGFLNLSDFSLTYYWITIIMVAMVITILASISYLKLEKPAIRYISSMKYRAIRLT